MALFLQRFMTPRYIGDVTPLLRVGSQRTRDFTESVIREMTRLAVRYGAVNLAQGFPDFPAPDWLKQAACDAILADVNQYSITWGSKLLREAIAGKYRKTYALEVDPEREITVCCGATEGMIAALLGLVDPGDEVLVFEPFYENYAPDTKLCGATRKLVRLHAPHWEIDERELRRAFTSKTRAIIINTPHNPTGKVFSLAELTLIAELCQEHDALALTDEIYEHIVYDGARHIPIITLPGMRERTVLVNSMSKTFSVTGWRVGWVIAAPEITATVRKVHDFLTVGAAAPLQQASAVALNTGEDYYSRLSEEYLGRRDYLIGILMEAGFACQPPAGAYYVMAGIPASSSALSDREFADQLVRVPGVAVVPASSFFENEKNSHQIRFCFCKSYDTLRESGTRLRQLAG
jgi:aspartate/methionine/tyrosine aminotransferase